ncbi:MAG: Na+/H+ antiporter subunit G [Cypionkella sp.]|jgi:multicomponent K+:H+ antiporter subunit G
MMQTIAEVIIAAILVLGGVFGLIGSYGLLRLKDAMQRLHAPTKASTIGVGAALIASAAQSIFLQGALSWHELMITVFLFLTAPIVAISLAKTLLHRHIDPASLPSAGEGNTWAGQDTSTEEQEPR